jgi:hypothetical protein
MAIADLIEVGERAWCERSRPAKNKSNAGADERTSAGRDQKSDKANRTQNKRPSRFIAFDTEAATDRTRLMPGFDGARWGWQTQALLFAAARTGWCKGMRVTDEIIFYPDDLPDYGVALIREYIDNNTVALAGNERRWRDEPSVSVHLMTLSQFMKAVFYDIAYRKRGLVIGFNLPFDFGRLAWNWGPSKSKRSAGGWSLTLWTYFDKQRGQTLRDKFKPNLTIKKAGPRLNFISFGSTREDKNGRSDKSKREN